MKWIVLIGILLLLHGMCFGKKMGTKKGGRSTRHHGSHYYPYYPPYHVGNKYCDVAIVGGGVSGLYMAYEILGEFPSEKVCVFEKESRLGGRILDRRFRQAPNIDVGMGAWRILKDQKIMIELLKELNIKHKNWTMKKPHLYKTRGKAIDNEESKDAYPEFRDHPKFGQMTEQELWQYVVKNVRKSKRYATLFTYLSNLITPEGAHYLLDKSFHRGEIQDIVSPTHFIEFLKKEFEYSSEYRRPEGGMSAIVKVLHEKVQSRGGHIYTNTQVISIKEKGTVYEISTPLRRKFEAFKLVIAVPPKPLGEIKGNVADKIKSTPQFKSILPMPAFKAAAVYKKAWWEKVKIGDSFVKAGQKFVSHDNCLGVSLPHRGKGSNSEGVLHTIYTDGHCARQWNKIATLNKNYFDKEVHRALEAKYGVRIKKPIDTVYKYWDSAWHFQKSGTRFSLKQIRRWAKRPFKHENIFLVGEAYNPQRAWVEGAIVSARYALREGWKIKRRRWYKIKKNKQKNRFYYMPHF